MKKFDNEQKLVIIKKYYAGKPVSEICKELGINRDRVYAWINKYSVEKPVKIEKRKGIHKDTFKRHCTTKMVCYTLKKETELRFDDYAKINGINKSAMVDRLINEEIDKAKNKEIEKVDKAKNKEIEQSNKTVVAEILVNLKFLLNKINL